tara:strand:+ start:264 stop:692 length:429 start_codon:yes stop_codon:yes gene_type:complete
MNEKILLPIFIGIILLTVGCGNTTSAGQYKLDKGRLVLDQEGTISEVYCKQRGLSNTILVLESKYCHACKEAVPKIKEAAKELGATVIYLDLAEKADQTRADNYGVLPYYTPTIIAGCKVYVGGKTKVEYTALIKSFLGKQK